MKRLRAAVCLLAAFWSTEASASAALERFRSKLRSDSADRAAAAMQQPQFQRARDSLCQPLQDAILETDLQIRNQPSTPALHKRHAELLTAVNTQYKERRGATQKLGSGEIDHFTILNICLRTAIAADRDVESYGLAKLTMIERPNEDNLLGRMWAATSLGLGKGVPRSKPEASAAMLGIAKLKTATPDLKAALADIAMSMYLEK